MDSKEMFEKLGYEYYENDECASEGYKLPYWKGQLNIIANAGAGLGIEMCDENGVPNESYEFTYEEIEAIEEFIKELKDKHWLFPNDEVSKAIAESDKEIFTATPLKVDESTNY